MESADIRLARALSSDLGVSKETRQAALALIDEAQETALFWQETAEAEGHRS